MSPGNYQMLIEQVCLLIQEYQEQKQLKKDYQPSRKSHWSTNKYKLYFSDMFAKSKS